MQLALFSGERPDTMLTVEGRKERHQEDSSWQSGASGDVGLRGSTHAEMMIAADPSGG